MSACSACTSASQSPFLGRGGANGGWPSVCWEKKNAIPVGRFNQRHRGDFETKSGASVGGRRGEKKHEAKWPLRVCFCPTPAPGADLHRLHPHDRPLPFRTAPTCGFWAPMFFLAARGAHLRVKKFAQKFHFASDVRGAVVLETEIGHDARQAICEKQLTRTDKHDSINSRIVRTISPGAATVAADGRHRPSRKRAKSPCSTAPRTRP
jgi:hypothetical protein